MGRATFLHRNVRRFFFVAEKKVSWVDCVFNGPNRSTRSSFFTPSASGRHSSTPSPQTTACTLNNDLFNLHCAHFGVLPPKKVFCFGLDKPLICLKLINLFDLTYSTYLLFKYLDFDEMFDR